ncbi:MAG: alpha/beta hydrolase family protein [Fimbriimonas sp.]
MPLLILSAFIISTAPMAYDPLQTESENPKTLDRTVRDATRKRDIPVRIYVPNSPRPAPVILFSHGLGGNREGSAYLGNHWARRGYVAVFVQHIGSDDSVWKNKPLLGRMKAMRDAASTANFLLRVQDIPAVLDQLRDWNRSANDQLKGKLDLAHIGMSGHSFGAVTTQALGGQQFPRGANFVDARIRAALALSPSSSARDPKESFGSVKIPWMLMTGTKDVSPIGNQTYESRLKVFPALPEGSKYQVVLKDAEHSAFSEGALRGDRIPRNPNHHRVVLALSTAFWDAYLRNDPAAKAWLDGSGARSVLQSGDSWQRR